MYAESEGKYGLQCRTMSLQMRSLHALQSCKDVTHIQIFAVQIIKSNIFTSFLLEHAFEMLKDQHAPRSCGDRESLFHPQDEKTTADNVAY